MVGLLILLFCVFLVLVGVELELSIFLWGDDGMVLGVDLGWLELLDFVVMMNLCF